MVPAIAKTAGHWKQQVSVENICKTCRSTGRATRCCTKWQSSQKRKYQTSWRWKKKAYISKKRKSLISVNHTHKRKKTRDMLYWHDIAATMDAMSREITTNAVDFPMDTSHDRFGIFKFAEIYWTAQMCPLYRQRKIFPWPTFDNR